MKNYFRAVDLELLTCRVRDNLNAKYSIESNIPDLIEPHLCDSSLSAASFVLHLLGQYDSQM